MKGIWERVFFFFGGGGGGEGEALLKFTYFGNSFMASLPMRHVLKLVLYPTV